MSLKPAQLINGINLIQLPIDLFENLLLMIRDCFCTLLRKVIIILLQDFVISVRQFGVRRPIDVRARVQLNGPTNRCAFSGSVFLVGKRESRSRQQKGERPHNRTSDNFRAQIKIIIAQFAAPVTNLKFHTFPITFKPPYFELKKLKWRG